MEKVDVGQKQHRSAQYMDEDYTKDDGAIENKGLLEDKHAHSRFGSINSLIFLALDTGTGFLLQSVKQMEEYSA